jgi:hypothetical protein
MAKVKITQAELDEVLKVAQRVAHRTNSKAIVLWDRVEIVPPLPES